MKKYEVLSRAILAGASAQIRNRATTAGNLLQRSRCPYFYDRSRPCNKRVPGSGCAAIGGVSRDTAILGVSTHCISQNPSDMAVALRLLDASITTIRPDGQTRTIPIADFHLTPGTTPEIETPLMHGELITSVILPPPLGGLHTYIKVRDRASFAFATVSVAAITGKDFQRFAFGGIATKPWRIEAAEALQGAKAIATRVLADSRTTEQNRFKQHLTYRTLARTLAVAQA
jgi:xanthine dehydrogenase YagS FAD-binding subunit